MNKFDHTRKNVSQLMTLLVEFARYQTPEKPIKDLKLKIPTCDIRKHAGSIGVMSIVAFNEILIAKNDYQKTAARVALYKITSFWGKKPAPRTDLTPIDIKNLEQEYEKAA